MLPRAPNERAPTTSVDRPAVEAAVGEPYRSAVDKRPPC